MKTPVVVAGALVVTALLVAPKFVGNMLEDRVNTIVETLDRSPMVDVSVIDYKKHWFSSDAMIELTYHSQIGTEQAKDFTVKLPLKMSQGPVILSNGTPTVALAQWHLEPEIDEALKSRVQWDQNTPLYLLTGRLGLTQQLSFKESLAPFNINLEGGSLKFSGYQGEGSGRSVIHYQGSADSLLLTTPETVITAKGWHVTLNTELDLDKLVDGSFYNMDANLSLDSLKLGDALVMDKLAVGVVSQYDPKAKLADTTVSYTADKVTGGEFAASDIALEVEVNNISDEFNDFYSDQMLSKLGKESIDQELLKQEMMKSLPLLLKSNPELNIKTLAVTLPEGSLSGHANFSVKGVDVDNLDLSNKMFWLQHLTADSSLSVDKPLAEKMASHFFELQQDKSQVVDIAQSRQMAQQQAAMTMMMLQGQGMLQDTGKAFKIDFSFDKGVANLNGKSMTLPKELMQ